MAPQLVSLLACTLALVLLAGPCWGVMPFMGAKVGYPMMMKSPMMLKGGYMGPGFGLGGVGAFGLGKGFGGYGPSFGGGFPGYGGYDDDDDDDYDDFYDPDDDLDDDLLLTCIGADHRDLNSQIRLTLRADDDDEYDDGNGFYGGPFSPMGIGMGGFGSKMGGLGAFGGKMAPLGAFGGKMGGIGGIGGIGGRARSRKDIPRNWHINGVMLPSRTVLKQGTYQVAVYDGGRVYPECKGAALGKVVVPRNNYQSGAGFMGGPSPYGLGVPPLSPLGLGMNPMMAMRGQRQRRMPAMASNPAVITGTGTTSYAGILQGLSYYDLIGHSIAACTHVVGGRCAGKIGYCCSIVADDLDAGSVYIDPFQQPGIQAFSPFGATGTGIIIDDDDDDDINGATVITTVGGAPIGGAGLFK